MIGNSGLGPAPTFSNWMRQPIGGTLSSASEQTSTRVADAPVRLDTMPQAASAPSQKRQIHHTAEEEVKRARVEDAAGLQHTAQLAKPRAQRTSTSKPQQAGRKVAATRTKRGPRFRSDSDDCPMFFGILQRIRAGRSCIKAKGCYMAPHSAGANLAKNHIGLPGAGA